MSGAGPLVNLPAMFQRYGDIAFWRFLHISTYFFENPDCVETVLVTKYRSFTKGIGVRANPELFGNGLLTSEGDFWLRQRRLSQPAFHRTRIAAYADVMVGEAETIMRRWRDGDQFDIHRAMMQTTLSIATRTLFGIDLGQRMHIVAEAMDAFVRQNAGLSVWRIFFKTPTLRRMRFLRGVRQLDDIVYGIIRERRASGAGEDLLSDFLRAQDEDGSSMTDKQLRDEVMTMLLAGHETTALALSWAWFLLATHPDEQARLHDELVHVLGGRLPTAADVPQLTFTNKVIRETLRLYPPAWVISRRASEEVDVGGYRVPEGSNIIVSQWVTHRDARYFPEPATFRPDRWTEDFERALPRLPAQLHREQFRADGGCGPSGGRRAALQDLNGAGCDSRAHAEYHPAPGQWRTGAVEESLSMSPTGWRTISSRPFAR